MPLVHIRSNLSVFVIQQKNHLLVNDVGMAKRFSKKYGNKG